MSGKLRWFTGILLAGLFLVIGFKLIQEELTGVEQLWKKNLVPITRVTALKREETRLRGERGQLISNVAQAKGRISETALQILQIDQDLRTEVGKELAEIRELKKEVAELRRANEILKTASAFFAAELDRPSRF